MDNVSSAGIRKTKPLEVICVIDVLLLDIAQVLFCMFMNLDLMSAHKHIRKEQGQYPAILLTVQAWSIKDLYILNCFREYFSYGTQRVVPRGQDPS